MAGGSLDPQHPQSGYMDYVWIARDGSRVISSSDPGRAYLRLWQIQNAETPIVTVAVFTVIGSALPTELARATGPR